MNKLFLVAIIASFAFLSGCYYYDDGYGTSYRSQPSYQLDPPGWGNNGLYDPSDGSYHNWSGSGYHKNSRGEVYDNDGNRLRKFE